jgi:pimeloyl-ACP methyl ester carboxylesterase
VIALDLPGNGLLNQQASPMRVQDMVEHCRAQLKARSIPPPYRLLAMSLGAMVAVAWAREYPNEIATQVLINTSMRPFSPFYDRLRPANYGALLKRVVLGASPETWERTILRITSNQAGEAVLPHWLALRQANPVSRTNALRQLVAAARFRAPTAPPAAATLVLASARDQLVSVACSKALAGHWQARLRIHPSTGHDLPLDDGAWVADQVRDWLMHWPGKPEL